MQDDELLAQLLKKLSFDCLDDLYAAIGYGGLTAVKAVGRIRDDLLKYTRGIQNPTRDGNVNPLRTNPDAPNPNRHSVNGVIVEDIDSCMIKFAKCCTPCRGIPLWALSPRALACPFIGRTAPTPRTGRIPARLPVGSGFAGAQEENQPFTTTLELDCTTRDGLLLDVATVMTSARVRVKELTGPGPARGPQHLYGVFRGEGCGGAQYHSDQAFEYPGCSRRPAGPELTGAPW